ncbi:MAG: site-specific integrase [Bacillota bacterium]|nr:site-specific integrase [Bacillota bacterium]
MATCIEQRGRSSWRVSISAGYKDGKQQKIHRSFRFPEEWSTEKQRKEVEKKAAILYSEFFNKQIAPGRDMLFSEFADLWLKEYAKINLEEKNCYGAQSRLKGHILPYFGNMRMSKIRTLTITKFINSLSAWKNPRTGFKLAPRTVINYITQLSSIFSTAVRWEIISNNPCCRIIKPKVESPDIVIPNETESVIILKLLEQESIKYQCIVYIGMMTGLRLGEIVGLKWSDIDFQAKQITVVRAMTYVPKIGNFDKSTKTKTSKRTVTVPVIILEKLILLQSRQQLDRERLGSKWQENSYLFISYDGSPLGHNTPSRWFRRFLLKVRQKQRDTQIAEGISEDHIKVIPIIRFHDLRHFHASILLAEGVDLETVSRRLGHARTSTTANIYCHPVMGRDAMASDTIENVLIKRAYLVNN